MGRRTSAFRKRTQPVGSSPYYKMRAFLLVDFGHALVLPPDRGGVVPLVALRLGEGLRMPARTRSHECVPHSTR
jgi:hypothetical protein